MRASAANIMLAQPNTVRAELVEAPFFLGTVERKERPFDKLRANGIGVFEVNCFIP
jgi:hypothetical protein